MRTLLLMRHAKSDYPAGVPDHDRPLAPRGERDADAAATWMAAVFPRLDEVAVSPARRAQQTWARVAARVQASAVREDSRIYEDWGSGLRDVMAGLSDDASIAMLVGHNPGIEEFALSLGERGDPSARARLMAKYPTSGIAVLLVPGSWARPGAVELAAFAVPRG